ncbi:hypothetical protein GCM10020221_19080 [Streptomyces thioluteus]|uniref:Glutamine--fructose-6-phosphate aminotransferase [isomerizing] n=1 Tax=Streptomyces thioluteus TaxID=66431 RepID=A0ABN3WNW7_STRTU
MATLKADDYRTYTTEGSSTSAQPTTVEWEAESYDMGGHDTYMHKEIHEQADAVDRALRGRIDDRFSTVHLGGLNLDARDARARAPGEDPGLRHLVPRRPDRRPDDRGSWPGSPPTPSRPPSSATATRSWTPTPSTSRCRSPVRPTTCSPPSRSSSARAPASWSGERGRFRDRPGRPDGGMYVHAGPRGLRRLHQVLFTNMVVAFGLFALHLGRTRDLSVADGKRIIEGLRKLPGQIEEILANEAQIEKLAAEYADAKSMMFIGRVRGYPVAREASLKLKEVSYIHAEAYPASGSSMARWP